MEPFIERRGLIDDMFFFVSSIWISEFRTSSYHDFRSSPV